MPSDNKKGPDTGSKNGVKEISHKKKKVSIGWIFGMAILILIAISFIAAPAIEAIVGGSGSNGIKFGSYDGESIAYTPDSYFYDQYQKYGSEYQGSTTDSNLALYQIWSQAFNSTVIYTAISQMANEIGITETEKTVNDAIVASGYYNIDGKFNVEAYNNTSTEQKASIRKSIVRAIPYQTVLNDVSSILTSDNEAEYIATMADNTRSFKYVSFDASQYPKELAAQYALANPQLFNMVDISIISVSTEEEATAAITEINGGTSFAEVATANSQDNYATDGGTIGSIPFYAIKSNFKNNEEAIDVLEAAKDSVVGPFATENGYAIYKVNEAPVIPDYTADSTLNIVRTYISNYDAEIMDTYLSEQAQAFKASVDSDFDSAAETAELTVNEVSATPKNIGGSQYMGNFTSSDTLGLLATAANEKETMKTLFDNEIESTLDPIKSGSSYIVAYVQSADENSGMGDYLKSVYPYYASGHNQNDMQTAVMNSSKLENNFLPVFIEKIMGDAN